MNLLPSTPWWLLATIGTALGTALAAPASAAVVLSPVHVSPGTTELPYMPSLLIDQSGLSAGYVSGSTDFDAYVASAPTHAAAGINGWKSQAPDNAPWVWFDLGEVYSVDALVFWAPDGSPGSAPAFFDVVAEVDGGYIKVAEDVVVLSPGAGMDGLPQRVDWAPVNARNLLLQIHCGPNDASCGLDEVAFRVSPSTVPEPSTLALLPVAGLGLAALRRRRAGAAA
jgi:hypothetical protein